MTSPNPSSATRLENNEARKYLQEEAVRTFTWATCLNCEHWNHQHETCGQFNARPPAPVILHGCPAWELDIPF